MRLLVIARRLRCDAVLCRRQIFTERFTERVRAGSIGVAHGEAGLWFLTSVWHWQSIGFAKRLTFRACVQPGIVARKKQGMREIAAKRRTDLF